MDEKLLTEIMDLGDRVKEFWNGEIGLYLQARLKAFEQQLLDAYQETPAHDEKAILKLQSKGMVPILFVKWVSEAIDSGEAAKQQLKEAKEEVQNEY